MYHHQPPVEHHQPRRTYHTDYSSPDYYPDKAREAGYPSDTYNPDGYHPDSYNPEKPHDMEPTGYYDWERQPTYGMEDDPHYAPAYAPQDEPAPVMYMPKDEPAPVMYMPSNTRPAFSPPLRYDVSFNADNSTSV